MTRTITIDGLVNVRDLGGLTTPDGRAVERGRVIRSDSLTYLGTRGEQDLVRVVQPKIIVDLRTPEELTAAGYELTDPSLNVINLPMYPQSALTPDQVKAGMPTNLVDDYLAQLEVNVSSLKEFVTLVAQEANQPIVVHCTSGKDRTGIASALILDLLGVDELSIADDYEMTTRALPTLIERLHNHHLFTENGLTSAPPWVFSSDAATMIGFLHGIRSRYSNTTEWAIQIGVDPHHIESLKRNLLTNSLEA
jgi:protein-tyrosine phosphatase